MEVANAKEVEQLIQDEELNAPRLSPEGLKAKIVNEEYHSFTTHNGTYLTWCMLTMENGFTVVGEPSACVSIENNNEKVGRQVAYNNSFDRLWSLEGYLLKDKLNN